MLCIKVTSLAGKIKFKKVKSKKKLIIKASRKDRNCICCVITKTVWGIIYIKALY